MDGRQSNLDPILCALRQLYDIFSRCFLKIKNKNLEVKLLRLKQHSEAIKKPKPSGLEGKPSWLLLPQSTGRNCSRACLWHALIAQIFLSSFRRWSNSCVHWCDLEILGLCDRSKLPLLRTTCTTTSRKHFGICRFKHIYRVGLAQFKEERSCCYAHPSAHVYKVGEEGRWPPILFWISYQDTESDLLKK